MSERWTPEAVWDLFARSLLRAEEEAASPELRAAAATLREEAPASASKEQVQGLERLIAREPLRAKGRPAISPLREAYRKSAAVLTALDPHRLRPLGLQAEPGSALNELVEDLVEAYEPASSAERWILRPELRERVLAGMAGRAELILALAANPERPKTLLQRTLDAYIHEPEPFALESQPLDQLMASLQAVRWLKAAGIDLPDPERIQELIELNQVPAVFEKMAGRYFAGREKEMARLRDYVGVLPPSTRFEDARRQFRKWFSLRKQPPLAIHAPGGAGKTTLVSRFILDHSRVPKDSKFPYVYLDFDNPQLTLRDPGTLLAEAVRQLSAQYPQARSQLKAFLADERRTSLNEQQAGGSGVGLDRSLERQESEAAEAASRFASLIHGIVHRTEDGQEFSLPFLLVLDTYEEVQRRGLSHEIRLWDLVEAIQRKFETLRVLVAGRAHLERIPTSNTPTESMRLDEFDIESGMGFLLHLGVTDSAVAKELYRQVGGNPLSLKLAAEIYRREGTNPAGMPELRRRLLFFSANESLVQGQLYQRILSHIRNPEVRRLAHPGLVLRRITPQLIREVLQGPCGVPVENDARAQELFAAMRGEVALVSVDADGALRHRPDVRRTMLKLLERDKPEQAEEINRLAVEFYSRRRGVAARAEEIYHRLQLRQPEKEIEQRWMHGVEEFLSGALDELPAESKALLAAKIGVRLGEADVNAAGRAEWERYTARRAEELLWLGHHQQALRVVRERRKRTEGSPLHLVEARALALLRRPAEAARAVEKAISASTTSGNRRDLLAALLLRAELAADRKDFEVADASLEDAGRVAVAANDLPKRILALIQRVRMRVSSPSPLRDAAGLRLQLARLLDALPDPEWSGNKSLVRAGVSLLGTEHPDLLLRMLMRVGLGTLSHLQREHLAVLIRLLRDDAAVRELTVAFANTLELRQGHESALPAEEMLLALQRAGRLEEYLQKLLPILLQSRETSRTASEAFVLLYLNQAVT